MQTITINRQLREKQAVYFSLKVGSKVTIEYTMKAATVEVKDAGKKAEPKKSEPKKEAPAKK